MATGTKRATNGHLGGQLPECEVQFNHINKGVDTVLNKLDKLTGVVAKLDESTRGLWHEIRQDIKPTMEKMGAKNDTDLNRHESDCPARSAVMARAAKHGASSVHPSANDELKITKFPQRLFFWFVGSGIMLGVAAFVLFKLGVFS